MTKIKQFGQNYYFWDADEGTYIGPFATTEEAMNAAEAHASEV